VHILGRLGSEADHVGLGKIVAAEDVVEDFKGTRAIDLVSSQIISGSYNLYVFEVVAR
jgi:hypothetical protein